MPAPASDYAIDVDRAVERRCGVGYDALVTMAPSLDPSRRVLDACQERNITPDRFARQFMIVHKMADAADGGDVRSYNERRAALIEFASTGRWKLTEGGAAIMKTASGDIRLDVVERDGKFGFGVRSVEAPESEAYLRLDIGDAVRGFMLRRRNDHGAGVPGPSADAETADLDAAPSPGMR